MRRTESLRKRICQAMDGRVVVRRIWGIRGKQRGWTDMPPCLRFSDVNHEGKAERMDHLVGGPMKRTGVPQNGQNCHPGAIGRAHLPQAGVSFMPVPVLAPCLPCAPWV